MLVLKLQLIALTKVVGFLLEGTKLFKCCCRVIKNNKLVIVFKKRLTYITSKFRMKNT